MKKDTSANKKVTKVIEKSLRNFVLRRMILDLIFILIGGYFIFNPYVGLRACEIAYGLVFVISGILALLDYKTKKLVPLFKYSVVCGALSVALGVLILLNPFGLVSFVNIILGAWIILSAVLNAVYAIYLKKSKEECWPIFVGVGTVKLIIGVLLVVNPFVQLYITRLVGIFLCLYSVLDFTTNILLKNRSKEIIKTFK